MRNILLAALAATVLTPVAAQAQSGREVRHDQREIQRDRDEVGRDVQNGRWREAREDRRELREDMRERNNDWRDYRSSHRDVYRRGAYRGPRGFVYRPVTIGYRFAPTYYSRNYWISDPWTYRLARPAAGLSWIRYGNDAVLVNLRNGRVVQIYNGFFW
jgi:Ni/Co efflux regulator RcnB